MTEGLLPPSYRPDPIGDVAAEVAAQLGSRLVSRDPVPDEELPAGAVY